MQPTGLKGFIFASRRLQDVIVDVGWRRIGAIDVTVRSRADTVHVLPLLVHMLDDVLLLLMVMMMLLLLLLLLLLLSTRITPTAV